MCRYYQLDPGRSLGKTNPLNEDDLAEFVKLAKTKVDSTNSWTVKVEDLDKETFDLTVKNPNKQIETVQRSPRAIAEEMAKIDKENAALLAEILRVVG